MFGITQSRFMTTKVPIDALFLLVVMALFICVMSPMFEEACGCGFRRITTISTNPSI